MRQTHPIQKDEGEFCRLISQVRTCPAAWNGSESGDLKPIQRVQHKPDKPADQRAIDANVLKVAADGGF